MATAAHYKGSLDPKSVPLCPAAMLRVHSKEVLHTPKQSPTRLNSQSTCHNSAKGKSVTFPPNSVTFVPESEHTRPGTLDGPRSDRTPSVKSQSSVDRQTRETPHHPEIPKTPCPSFRVNGDRVWTPTSAERGDQPSPATFFDSLKRERLERGESVENLSQEEWKATAESYFEHEESARRYKESVYAARGLAPAIETSVTASNSRRYSAVVQQFMQKNGLVTPLTDTELVTRQADQARDADPSYVSWGSVDLGSTDLNTHLPAESPLTSEKDRRAATASPLAESFKLQSLFAPNQSVEPATALGEVSNFASYTDVGSAATSSSGRPDEQTAAPEKSFSSESSDSEEQCEDSEDTQNMDNNKGRKSNSLWITPPRRPSTAAESSHAGTPVLHPSPLRPNHMQVLSISEDSARQQEKLCAKQRMAAVALIVLGTIIVLAAVIAILVLLI